LTDFLVAALQITSTSNVESNFAEAEEQIELASRRGAELIGLPENFAFLGDDEQKLAISSELSEKCTSFLKTMSQRYQVLLLGGGYPVPAGDGTHVFNRCALFGKDGQILGKYDKIHLFDVDLPDGNLYKESSTILSGSEKPPIIDIPGLCKIGLSICYDVRFPELYRYLSSEGAELLMIPAAFTAFTGKDHWQILLQARAIENTAYVVAPAQTGNHYGRRQSHGHAMVIDPWGTVLSDAGKMQGAAIAPADRNCVYKIRQQMPSLKHTKSELFIS
tara:strand:- start:237 stop:1064 length:828 start_codon:yes stop_codon:yes gene_type:complete